MKEINIVLTCFRYESSMVGSYSSTKWFCISWIVSADLPTPPAPTTTSLYSVMMQFLNTSIIACIISCWSLLGLSANNKRIQDCDMFYIYIYVCICIFIYQSNLFLKSFWKLGNLIKEIYFSQKSYQKDKIKRSKLWKHYIYVMFRETFNIKMKTC